MDPVEQEIRKLEQRQVELLLRGEVAEMEKQWAKDYMVNNPFNKLVKADITVTEGMPNLTGPESLFFGRLRPCSRSGK
jgi:hypothetical protein